MQLGDDFIRARAIDGFEDLKTPSTTALFVNWLTTAYAAYNQRGLRLQLSHWLGGLTCFSLEDIYLSVGVQMDLIKQRERTATGNNGLTYFQGMTSASTRYGLPALGNDYKNMRNDIVHEGVLSGSNYVGQVEGRLHWCRCRHAELAGPVRAVGPSGWRGTSRMFPVGARRICCTNCPLSPCGKRQSNCVRGTGQSETDAGSWGSDVAAACNEIMSLVRWRSHRSNASRISSI